MQSKFKLSVPSKCLLIRNLLTTSTGSKVFSFIKIKY